MFGMETKSHRRCGDLTEWTFQRDEEKMLKQLTSLAAAVAFATTASAGASYGFMNITNNNAGDAAIGEAQFVVDVIDAGLGSVEFLFTNSGPYASSMVQLYWDDTTSVLSSLDSWSTTTPGGVDYSGGSANPSNLPGGNPIGFSADFSIEPKNQGGKSTNGVGVNEDVSIFFSGTYLDIVEAIDNGELVVGLHAQAFRSGGSESFVTGGTPDPPTTTGVPSPTAGLAGLGLLGLMVSRRRRG